MRKYGPCASALVCSESGGYMKIGSSTGLAPDWGSSPDPAVTQTRTGETLALVASRLGVSVEDLQRANPQIGDPNKLTPGLEIRIPAPALDDSAGNAESDGTVSAGSKYMESNVEASLMKSLVSGGSPLNVMPGNNSAQGSGGITQMPPVAVPLYGAQYSEQDKEELSAGLRRTYQAAEHLGVGHDDIVAMLHTLAGNRPLTSEKMTGALHLFFMAKDLAPADRKLVGDAFKASHTDPAYVAALSKLVVDPKFANASTKVKKEWLENFDILSKSPELKGLSPDEKSIVIQALASDPPPAADKISKTLAVLTSAKDLSPADRKLFMDGLKAAGGDPAYAASLKKLIEDPKFKGLKPAEKTAVLSQTKNYADAQAVTNIDRLLQKNWFRAESLNDKQRSLKTIARLSQYPIGDRQVINNTLDKLLGASSSIKIEWKDYPDSVKHGTTYGEADGNVLYLNKGKVPANNEKLIETDDTNHLALNTTVHEMNHHINNDKVASTFHYFEAEYRAWYIGFKAEHGRAPTNEEAMDQRISWQLNPDSAYGKYAAAALKNPKEAQKFYDFLGSVTGMKVDAKNWKAVVKSDPATWPDKGHSPAAAPSGNIDNH
jgi:LysM repeat protein